MSAILAFFAPGPIQLVIVLVVVVMLFGNRIPSVMRSLGLGITEFKKGIKGELPDPDDSSEKIEDKQ
jgi:sec-independent protein translocase protein TatA